jgi:hypothetical protein
MALRSLGFSALSLAVGVAIAPACGGSSGGDDPLFLQSSAEGGSSASQDGAVGEPSSDGASSDGRGPTDGRAQPDAPPSDPGVLCGTSQCVVGKQECCRTEEGQTVTFDCVTRGSCVLSNQLAIPCDDASDCAALGSPGALCCALADKGAVSQVACTAAANCPLSAGDYVFCDPSAANPCPNGGVCRSSASPTIPYSYCKP